MVHFGSNIGAEAVLVGGIVAVSSVVCGIASESFRQRLRAQQRMALIARGASPEEIERVLGSMTGEDAGVRTDPRDQMRNTRMAATVLVSAGIGLMVFFAALSMILAEHKMLIGVAARVIPIALGIGFAVDYKNQRRELSRLFGDELDSEFTERC